MIVGIMAGAKALKPTFVAGLVGHIYEAALDPQRWHKVLDALDHLYPDARITLFGHSQGRPGANFSFRKNFPEDDVRAYFDYFITRSPYIDRIDRCGLGVPAYSEAMISDAELLKTEYYNDFSRSRRLGHYATGIVFEHTPCATTALSIADHKDDIDRRSHQVRTLGILLPHLQRALDLHRVVSRERAAAIATQTLFDRWTHAAFVIDIFGRVVSMNAAATSMLKVESCLWLDRVGNLRVADGGEGSALENAIRRLARLGDSLDLAAGDGLQKGFSLPRAEPQPPLQAMAWPLPAVDEMSSLGGEHGRVLLMVFDPLKVARTPIGWLSRQYGLTHGEAKLLDTVVNGVPLANAAEQLGIQLSTARSRLKVILSKTGCSRQVDLVRLAMSMPSLGKD